MEKLRDIHTQKNIVLFLSINKIDEQKVKREIYMKRPVIEFKDFSFQYRAQAKPTLNNINLT